MKRGFTLIEMVVVLAIIALVTHLAVRQLDRSRDHRLIAAADRQLEAIREAVYGTDADGAPTGFLADMGRLVWATNKTQRTLAELWQRPSGVRAYAVLPATRENFVRLSDDDLKDLTNANVFVATGWRGPYLHLPLGRTRLRDPWGNPLETPDAAGLARLDVTNGRACAVRHFGPTAIENDPHRRQISLVPDGGATSRLIVSVASKANETTGSVTYRWYGPCGGLITGAVEKVAAFGVPHVFDGLTPGRRVVQAEWGTETPRRTATRLVNVRPGDNQVEIVVP